MPAPTIRPAADPLDDIDREAVGVDSVMARQDRADLPGERSDQRGARRSPGDVYIDAAREVSRGLPELDQEPLDGEADLDSVVDGALAADLTRESLGPRPTGLGADDDDPIDETERAGDDSLR